MQSTEAAAAAGSTTNARMKMTKRAIIVASISKGHFAHGDIDE